MYIYIYIDIYYILYICTVKRRTLDVSFYYYNAIKGK